jgi:phosphopantothenoylcysteine decarboxylase/phosphopantothenate--cysteine ligase
MKQKLLIGITGGIAAYKIPLLLSSLYKQGFDIHVLLTYSASKIVNSKTYEKITGNPVQRELFTASFSYKKIIRQRKVDHIELTKHARCYAIVPATANCIAKLAHGIADDYVTTTALAVTCPVLIFPSMNTNMWNHPATQKNISKLKSLGYIVVEPAVGRLACGDTGKGKLPSLDTIEKEIIRIAERSHQLKGKTIIITAGGTSEKIDDVRYITNKSSGKMGVAIAEQLFLRGANVLLFRSITSVQPRYPIKELIFETADDLERLLKKYVRRADMCFHVAAVSDFSVSHPFNGKSSSDKPLPLELTPRSKILDTIKSINPRITLIASKAEWRVSPKTLVTVARKRLKKSHADIILANDVGIKGQGFASDANEMYVIDSNGTMKHFPKMNKLRLAAKILDYLIEKKVFTV